MSAAETERVEVDVSPSEYVEADAEADDLGASSASSASKSTSRRGFMQMLTSTTPGERPAEQDGTFSTDAKWYQHLELGVKKATGADGTPAWLNLTMSAFLLVAESANLPGADEQDEQDDSADPADSVTRDRSNAHGDPADAEALDSGKVATHENGETSVIGG